MLGLQTRSQKTEEGDEGSCCLVFIPQQRERPALHVAERSGLVLELVQDGAEEQPVDLRPNTLEAHSKM